MITDTRNRASVTCSNKKNKLHGEEEEEGRPKKIIETFEH